MMYYGQVMHKGCLLQCPNCGERGPSYWEGPNPKPHTANRGLFVAVCGESYGCTINHVNPLEHCYKVFICCYRCSHFGEAVPWLKNMVVAPVIPNC